MVRQTVFSSCTIYIIYVLCSRHHEQVTKLEMLSQCWEFQTLKTGCFHAFLFLKISWVRFLKRMEQEYSRFPSFLVLIWLLNVLAAFMLLNKQFRLLSFLVISSLVSCRVVRHLSVTHYFPIRLTWILPFFSVRRRKVKTSCPVKNEWMELFSLIIANFPLNLRWQDSVAEQVVNPVLW